MAHFLKSTCLNLVFLTWILPKTCISTDNYIKPESDLVKHLLSDYNRDARPISDPDDPITVLFDLLLGRVDELNGKDQVLITSGWLRLVWTDSFLRWQPADHSGVTKLVLETDSIWMPEVVIMNSAYQSYDISRNLPFRATIRHDGQVTWIPGLKFETTCDVNLVHFPFDRQECFINITNWSFGEDLVNFTTRSTIVQLNFYQMSSEWILMNTSAHWLAVTSADSNVNSRAPVVSFWLSLKRRSGFYVVNLLVPCILLTLASLMVFWLPCDSGEKVSLAISVLLSYTVLMLFLANFLPKSSEKIPVLGMYIVLNVGLTSFSLLLTVCVLHIRHKNPTSSPPRWLQNYVLRGLAKVLCMELTPSSYIPPRMTVGHRRIRNQVSWMNHVYSDGPSGVLLHCDPAEVNNHNSHTAQLPEAASFPADVTDHVPRFHVLYEGEWIMLSQVIDRFFLVMYGIVVVSTTCVMLGELCKQT